jgi:eukaryotic-like serine/threonine-protein kinase
MSNTSDRDNRLYEALAVYYEAANPDRAALLAAYPDLADALAEHFAEQDRLSAMAAPLRPLPTGESPTTPRSADGKSELPPVGDSVHYFGDYELIRELARGGMGVVFEARQVSLNRPVALKMILTGVLASDDDRRRFRLEAEAVANLDHPHIVPIHEVGEHAGFSYFSMKLIPGGSLATRLGDFVDRPRDAARVVAIVARAVHHAHQRGILHRDLKPSNVLLDAEGLPHVVDFGLAKRTKTVGELTATGAVLGTPAYMAPEQAMGKRALVTIATDVYGLGAILYTLLAGKAPFGGDSVIDTLEQVKLRVPDPPSGPNREVARDLQTICLKCLEKDPARRYATAEALATDLDRYLRGEPIAARRVGRAERTWLWAKRRPAIAALSAATVFAVLAGTSGVIAVQARANRILSGKNTELAKTIGLLDQERNRAKSREQQAIDAVKRFRDAVTNEPRLKNSAELEELRKRLLKEPLEFFKSLREQLEADHDTRPEALESLASAALELGTLTREIGDQENALGAYQEARAIHERLARENPTVTRFQIKLAGSHNDIGNLLRVTGKPVEALAAYEQARVIRERLARESPTVSAFQSDLAGSHINIGNLLGDSGKPAEALAAYEQARAIQERLARENPTVTEFQSELAKSHNNIGILLREAGTPAEALAAHEQARVIQGRLARENPTVTRFQSDLAASRYNIANLLSEAGKLGEALAAHDQALAIRMRLARENPSVTEFQDALAESHFFIGFLLSATGKPAEALATHELARAIRVRLARENPTVTQFQSALAASHNDIGSLLRETGKPAEALAAFEEARAIRVRLAREHPESPDYASNVGGCLNNLALIDLEAGRFSMGCDRLREAIVWQKRALSVNPRHPTYRQFLRNHLTNLIRAASGLSNAEEIAAAQRELDELDASDPAKLALDARLNSVLRGEEVKTNAERLQLAYHAYERARYSASARLFAEALEREPNLAGDRQRQHAYNAACSAARAAGLKTDIAQPSAVQAVATTGPVARERANQTERPQQPLSATKRRKLRNQARSWLQDELAIWAKMFETANEQQRAFIAATLKHWFQDPDLISVRGTSSLDALPDDERQHWRSLWDEVRNLLKRAAGEPHPHDGRAMPNGTDAFALH